VIDENLELVGSDKVENGSQSLHFVHAKNSLDVKTSYNLWTVLRQNCSGLWLTSVGLRPIKGTIVSCGQRKVMDDVSMWEGLVVALSTNSVFSDLFTVLFVTYVKAGITLRHVVEVLTSREEDQSKHEQQATCHR